MPVHRLAQEGKRLARIHPFPRGKSGQHRATTAANDRQAAMFGHWYRDEFFAQRLRDSFRTFYAKR